MYYESANATTRSYQPGSIDMRGTRLALTRRVAAAYHSPHTIIRD